MNFQRNHLKVFLILASALTIAGCSGKKSNEVVEKTPESIPQEEESASTAEDQIEDPRRRRRRSSASNE